MNDGTTSIHLRGASITPDSTAAPCATTHTGSDAGILPAQVQVITRGVMVALKAYRFTLSIGRRFEWACQSWSPTVIAAICEAVLDNPDARGEDIAQSVGATKSQVNRIRRAMKEQVAY